MKRGMLTIAFVALLCGSICPTSYAEPQAAKDPMETLAKKLADRLVTKKRTRVTVLDFTDIQNRPNELGRYLALQLANELVNLTDIAVLDRANIATIMAEHKLTAEGLLRPEDAKKLGQFAGVDAILIGNLSLMGESVELFVRGISTETSEIVASGKATLPATKDTSRMLGLSVDGASAGSQAQGAGGTTATEGAAIATREVGPITAVLRNVAEHSVRTSEGDIPAIRCTFDLQNRNLQRSVGVAANHEMNRSRELCFRGDLVDSDRTRWTLVKVTGISAVVCYEVNRGCLFSRNPGGVVDSIRTAINADSAKQTFHDGDRFWSGSFSSIPPGQKVRTTVDFVPAARPGRERGRSGGRSDMSSWTRPDHFQFDMELVLGTYAEGEDPVKAKDLTLRNLTIDRVVLAGKPTASAP